MRAVVICLALAVAACGQVSRRASGIANGSEAEPEAERLWKAREYKAAVHQFEIALRENPNGAQVRVRFGRLMLERFNTGEAAKLFREALSKEPQNADALLGMALVAEAAYDGKAADLAHDALKSNPRLTEAQELLARLAMEDNDPKLARSEADAALKLDPHSLTAEAVHASADLLEHQPSDSWLASIASGHPKEGEGYELIGHLFDLNRRYEDAIEYFRKALAAQPDLYSARTQLGLNLMRLGRETEAKKELEAVFNSFNADPSTKNTLKLMDTYKSFQTFRGKTTILKLDEKEAAVLRLYIEPEFEKALAVYRKKYEYKLPRAVQLEVYPRHPDFEIRTTGMPGIGGILGVTFQDVVAMDSPSARTPGEFHWGATMWHELSHVYILSITRQRVPRWFTEGVAVHEESQVSPDWGDRLTPDVLQAIKDNKLLPVAQLDRGFIHPKYPGQVVISYYQAGKIIDFVAAQWGEHKVLDMVHAFAGTDSTVDVIRSQLGLKPEEFDAKFEAWLNGQNRNDLDHLDQWKKDIKALKTASEEKHYDEVIAQAPQTIAEFPGFVEPGNAYEFAAAAYEAKGDKPAAAAELEKYSQAGGRDPKLLEDAARLLKEEGQAARATHVLERLIYIDPLDERLHTMLGELYLDRHNVPGSLREYGALVAGKSPDQAAAHFGLARAYHLDRKDELAKDELVQALETAPNFKPAQKLLLELNASD